MSANQTLAFIFLELPSDEGIYRVSYIEVLICKDIIRYEDRLVDIRNFLISFLIFQATKWLLYLRYNISVFISIEGKTWRCIFSCILLHTTAFSFTLPYSSWEEWQWSVMYQTKLQMFLYQLLIIACLSKREVPRGVRNSKVRRQDKFRKDWSRH